MTQAPLSQSTSLAGEILFGIKISQIYRALVGKEPRRSGPNRWRAPAVWRDGDGFNVSMDDVRNVWHDFVTGEGGGVLDFVVLLTGRSRQDALRWVAELVGRPLDNRGQPSSERARWAKQREQTELELPRARMWRRTVVCLGEQVLDGLKGGLVDPAAPWPDVGEIARWTAQIEEWRRLDGASLVAEFLWWAEHHPNLTRGIIFAATTRQTAERQALFAYLGYGQEKDQL